MNEAMQQKWRDLLRTWQVDPAVADRTWEDIVRRYSEPSRFYHTIDHIHDMLETVKGLGSHAPNLNCIKLATWLHDVIYDSRASDNEERSAEYAERLCKELGIQEARVVAALILKTKTHDAGADADSHVLIDADLAILGASEQSYVTYAEQIRQEYAWVPDPEYRAGRRRVLEQFLARPRIYHFLIDIEEPARRNIATEIRRLER
jgi:predicted metal-dependent HD superfamily phosphohydrolase